MILRGLVAAAVLGLAACGSSTARPAGVPEASSARATCGPAAARTVAADGVARVYRVAGAVYGCSAVSGRRTLLGHTSFSARDRTRLTSVRLAGDCVALAVTSMGVDTGGAVVEVRRLRTGARVVSAPAVDRGLVESVDSVPSLVVRAGGAVAWIGQASSIIHHARSLEVHRITLGHAAVLDRGPGIVPGSLRLRGSALSWRDGERTRTATLPLR